MLSSPSHAARTPRARVLARTAVALVVTVLAAAPGAWTATVASAAPTVTVVDTPGQTCDGRGFTKLDSASGDVTLAFGRLVWSGRTLTFTAAPGWTVELCVKGGNDARLVEISRTGSYTHTHPQDISHIGYRAPQETVAPRPVTALPATVVPSAACEVEGTLTVPSVAGVEYLLDGAVVAGTLTGPLAGTLTARALPGHVLTAPFRQDVQLPAAADCPDGGPVTVTAVAATVVPSSACEVEGTLVVPATTGVEYRLDGRVVTGTLTGPLDGTLVARALDGFVLAAPLTQRVQLPAADDCPGGLVTVTPVAPAVVPSSACGIEGTLTVPVTDGVEYLLDGAVVTGTLTGPLSGELTARALPGHRLSAPLRTDVDLAPAEDCPGAGPVLVTAVAPAVTLSAACDVQGSVVLTPVAGVEYLLDGTVVAGTLAGPVAGELTARALPGHVLSAPLRRDVVVPAALPCTEVLGGTITPPVTAAPPAVTPRTDAAPARVAAAPVALPFTGLRTLDLAGLGALLLLAGGVAVQLGRPVRGAHVRR